MFGEMEKNEPIGDFSKLPTELIDLVLSTCQLSERLRVVRLSKASREIFLSLPCYPLHFLSSDLNQLFDLGALLLKQPNDFETWWFSSSLVLKATRFEVFHSCSLPHRLSLYRIRSFVGRACSLEKAHTTDIQPAQEVRLSWPIGLAFRRSDSSLFISDYDSHVVFRVDSQGLVHRFAGTRQNEGDAGDGGPATEATITNPWSLCTQETEHTFKLFIGEYANHAIRMIDENNIIHTLVIDARKELFKETCYMTCKPDGSILFTNYENHPIGILQTDGLLQVLPITPTQEVMVPQKSGLKFGTDPIPRAIAALRDGRIVYGDTQNHCLQVIDTLGHASPLVLTLGEPCDTNKEEGVPTDLTRLTQIKGIAEDWNGCLWISEPNRRVVRMIDSEGRIWRVAGQVGVICIHKHSTSTPLLVLPPSV